MANRLPDFVIIGAQKAGTTWLGSRLAEQPSIFLPRPFEVHYFDRPDNFARGPEWYAGHFAAAPADVLVGEKTPDYLWTTRPAGRGPNDIPERMHRLLPNALLLVGLRDPVRRAISALNHIIRVGWQSPFVNPDALLTEALDPARDRYGLIGRGCYLTQLQRFLEFYPRERIQVIFFEDDIIRAPQETLDRITGFLGRGSAQPIPRRTRPENKRMNSRLGLIASYYAPKLAPLISVVDRTLPAAPAVTPSPGCIARLYEYFAPHNRALFDLLGRSTSAWMQKVEAAA